MSEQEAAASEGELARTRDIAIAPDEVSDVVRFLNEMRARKAASAGIPPVPLDALKTAIQVMIRAGMSMDPGDPAWQRLWDELP